MKAIDPAVEAAREQRHRRRGSERPRLPRPRRRRRTRSDARIDRQARDAGARRSSHADGIAAADGRRTPPPRAAAPPSRSRTEPPRREPELLDTAAPSPEPRHGAIEPRARWRHARARSSSIERPPARTPSRSTGSRPTAFDARDAARPLDRRARSRTHRADRPRRRLRATRRRRRHSDVDADAAAGRAGRRAARLRDARAERAAASASRRPAARSPSDVDRSRRARRRRGVDAVEDGRADRSAAICRSIMPRAARGRGVRRAETSR